MIPGIRVFVLIIGYSLACISFGLLIFRILRLRTFQSEFSEFSPLIIFSTAFLLGQGLLANLWLLLSLAGWFTPVMVKIISLFAFLSGLFFFPKPASGLWQQVKNIYKDTRSDSWAWQGIAVLSLLFCLAGVTSLGAPLLEDAANYYMTQPKVIADTFHYILLPFKDVYYGGGFQGEMNHAVFMSLDSPDAARMFSWPTMLAGAAMLLALCSRAGIKRRGQWIALAMFVTSSLINTLLGKGKIDLFPMAMGLGVYFWASQRGALPLRVTGMLAGFAVLGKMVFAITLIPGILILLLWQPLENCSAKGKFKVFFFRIFQIGLNLGLTGFLSVIPLAIYNIVLFQNILRANSLFSEFLGWGNFTPDIPPYIYFTYPLFLTFGRLRLGQLGNLSVLVLMFLPLALLIPRSRPWKKSLLTAITLSGIFGIVIYFFLFPTVVAPRYFSSCMFLFIPLAAGSAEVITCDEFHPRILTFIILGSLYIVLSATFIENTQGGYYDSFFINKTISYFSGEISGCGLEEGAFNFSRCRALLAINKQSKPGDRVLSDVYHNYYLKSDLLVCSNTESIAHYGFPKNKSWEPNWNLIYRDGFRFMVVDNSYDPFPTIYPHPEWVNPVEIYKDNELVAYRLDYLKMQGINQTTCQKTQTGLWKVIP